MLGDRAASYGVAGAFGTSEGLVRAAEAVAAAGYRRVETYTPEPVEGVPVALRLSRTPMAAIMGCGGLVGVVGGFGMQVWGMAVAYPMNVGGRPLVSWPMYVPITFECGILCAVVSGVVGMLWLNRLPRWSDPVFGVAGFERASVDRYFLVVEAGDPKFEAGAVRALLEGAGAEDVSEVAR